MIWKVQFQLTRSIEKNWNKVTEQFPRVIATTEAPVNNEKVNT